MTKFATIAAALALLTSSAALAQTDAPEMGGPPPAAEAPTMQEQMGQASTAAPEQMRDDDRRSRRAERRERRERREAQRAERRGQGHGRMRHHGRMHEAMHGGERGAVFRFNAGEGGPSFRIRCAAQDTTQECAQAVLPMLDRLLPADDTGIGQ